MLAGGVEGMGGWLMASIVRMAAWTLGQPASNKAQKAVSTVYDHGFLFCMISLFT